MKQIAISLAVLMLVWGGDTKASELAGKGLICGKGVSKHNFLFFDKKVGKYSVIAFGTILAPMEVSGPRTFDHHYFVSEDVVTWDKFTIDRKTLILTYDHPNAFTDGTGVKWSHQCRLTDKQGIEREIDREVKARKASMKKNKL